MGNYASRRKKRRGRDHVTDQDRAVLDLKNARDRLKRYQKKLDLECNKLQAQALVMIREKRKDRALLLLKVKKLKQDQADKADAQLLSVHQLIETIDWESQQLQVFNALKEGNAALNKLHEEMPLDKVEELMADTAESIAIGEEISKAIGQSWTDANEDDLLAELAELESETAPAAAAVAAGGGGSTSLEDLLPEVPTEKPTPAASAATAAAQEEQQQQEEEGEGKTRPTLVPA